jgi:histidinol dehydrogenase
MVENQAFVRRLDSGAPGFAAALAALTAVEIVRDEQLEKTVVDILGDVRRRGDAAVLDYTRKFDGVAAGSASELEISRVDLQAALSALGAAERDLLEVAAARVRSFHERQGATSWRYTEPDGTVLGQRIAPLDRVGLYVPGGRAAYPSSVIMNAVPAKVAGVPEIIMVVPTPGGERNRLVLAAAALSGVDRVFTIGGAQAIGALAYGTETIPGVDKIVGPGNAYVAAAKRQVFGQVGIDMIAGPSEILIICDGETDPDWIAMDLYSQAEHDEMAQAILLSPDADFLDKVESSMRRALESLPRREVIEGSIAKRGALIKVKDLDEACAIANEIAPEHLELSVSQPEALLERIRHAGAIFLGRDTSEALGDYCAGPNHVLPTSRSARFSSPLGVYDFQKRSSIIGASPAGARALGRIAAALARGEGLEAHARSAEYRMGG